MLSGFEKKVADYVKANGLFASGGKVLLAVSGGADSTALLHVVHTLKAAGALNAEFVCAHVNHQLRSSDADRDEDFVTARAGELKVPVIARRVDVRRYARRNKLSIETAARQLRIQALSDAARDNDCDAIATAHQKNDNAETIVQRLTRGTGFRGLAGIWPKRVFADGTRFVRPLLCVRREEILEYLRSRNLHWRDDRTNADCAHRRNYIRHRLLPELQQNCAHSIVEQLSELARSARGFYSLIAARADELWPEIAGDVGKETRLDVGTLLSQATPVKIELVRRCLEQIGCGERYLTQGHYENILQLAEQNVTGRKIKLPGGFAVLREYGKLMLGPARECSVGQAPPYGDESATLNVPGQTRFGGCVIEATIVDADEAGFERFVAGKTDRVERFDLEKIRLPLTVRRRRPGDRFVPLGLKSEKKIGKFLTAQRIPRRLREKVLVVADGDKTIWVCPVRISEPAKVTSRTRSGLQLEMTDLEHRQNSVDAMAPGQ
jgi:tRNA(Ile)-lysidine synthase